MKSHVSNVQSLYKNIRLIITWTNTQGGKTVEDKTSNVKAIKEISLKISCVFSSICKLFQFYLFREINFSYFV